MKRHLFLQIKEMLERTSDIWEVARRCNIDVADVQFVIEVLKNLAS